MYGVIIFGSSKQGYVVCLDELPASKQNVKISWNKLKVVCSGKEEVVTDHQSLLMQEFHDQHEAAARAKYSKYSANSSWTQYKEVLQNLRRYTGKLVPSEENKTEWQIMKDNEYVEEDSL